MNNTAIIIGTYNRAHLLRRSLLHYPDNVDIYVYDDGSADNTKQVCWQIAGYKYLGHKKEWRDSASYLNMGISEALKDGYDYIFITHPEIIPGKTTIESAKELCADRRTWISAKGYYLNPEQQSLLKDDISNLKDLPGFYTNIVSAEFMHLQDYLPQNVEKITVWHSWIFGGGSASMWRYFGGLTPFNNWGSVDVDLNDRRRIGGMKTVTPNKLSDIVIHQNHDDLGTPRDMKLCMKSLHVYKTPQECLKPQLLL